ncbi:hypothetical protein B0H11DRAFT_1941769 [Mycena galericulata]|nr:hypothetical protein B0H11DRAFT_1941769 [Mycena galericulata]
MPCRDQELFAAQVHPTGGGSAGAFPVAFRLGCPPLLPLRSVLDSHFRCYCAGSANASVKHLVSSTPLEYGGHARGLPKAASSAVEAGEQGLANETRIIILTVKEKRMFSLGFEPLPAGKIFTGGHLPLPPPPTWQSIYTIPPPVADTLTSHYSGKSPIKLLSSLLCILGPEHTYAFDDRQSNSPAQKRPHGQRVKRFGACEAACDVGVET